jgi:hypothetical protein
LGNVYNFFFVFLHFPTLSFCRMPHFLISNSLCKGLNWLPSWGIRHGHFICLKFLSKIECNNVFLSCIELWMASCK